MSVTVTRDPRGVRVLVVAPGPQGVKGDKGDQGDEGPMPVVGTAAARDVPEQGKDATSAQVVLGSDTRLTDSRTPRAHTHDIDDVDALPALLDALALEIDGCAPASHTHAMGQVTGLGDALAGKAASKHTHVANEVTDLGSAAKCSVPAAGRDAAAAEVVLGSDTRLTDARTPTVHAATHSPGGADPLPELAKLGNLLRPDLALCRTTSDLLWAATSAPTVDATPGAHVGATLTGVAASGGTVSIGLHGWTNRGSWPVTPGQTMTWQCLARVESASQIFVRILWWRADGLTAAAPSLSDGPRVPPAAGGAWTPLTVTATVPPDARFASLMLIFVAATGSWAQAQRGLWVGAGGDWRPPGEPIPGLGWQRRSPAGGVDWVLERWDGAQWVLIDGDTGPRAVGASGRAHRRGQMVTWTATDVAAPAGWRDGYSTGQKCYMTPDPWPTGALPGVPA